MTPGEAAYGAWRECTIRALAATEPCYLAKWKGLPASARAAWEEIAAVAINQHIDNRDALMQDYR